MFDGGERPESLPVEAHDFIANSGKHAFHLMVFTLREGRALRGSPRGFQGGPDDRARPLPPTRRSPAAKRGTRSASRGRARSTR